MARTIRTVDLCARFGGEELAILLPQTAAAGAFELADRLRRRIAGQPIRYHDAEISVTASFGVGSYLDNARRPGRAVPRGRRGAVRRQAGGPKLREAVRAK